MLSGVIHAVSFASQGEPYDEGLPLGQDTLIEWGKLCIEGGASTYRWFTPMILNTPEDAWCVQRYSDEHTMSTNPGYHKIGLGAWRAVILKKTVDEAVDGDVVVVHCANFHKTPDMKLFAGNLRRYVEIVTKFTDVFAPPHASVARYTSKEVLNLIPDHETREIVAGAPCGQCRLIIVKVTPATRAFVKLFEQTLKDDPLLLSPYNKTPYLGRRLCHTTAEQSVFNVLAYREGFFPIPWRRTWIKHLEIAGNPGSGTEDVLRYDKYLKRKLAESQATFGQGLPK